MFKISRYILIIQQIVSIMLRNSEFLVKLFIGRALEDNR